MKIFSIAVLLVAAMTLAGGSLRAADRGATIKGYVIDSACTFAKNLKKPISRECAIACAKAGSPLVILTDKGAIYWPISSAVPAAGQNDRLLPFAGERVVVTGMVYEKGGSHAIVIEKVMAAPAGQ
jgi:hypothetical protein